MKRYKWLFLLACASSVGTVANAQAPTDPVALKAFRSDVINAVFSKVKKKHFQPRAIDDVYATAVWKHYLQTIDPYSSILLQQDIDQLAKYKTTIDDEINTGRTDFFDAAFALLEQRVKETEALCMQHLAKPFDFKQKESIANNADAFHYPTTLAERSERWRKLMKSYVLRNYIEMKMSSGDTTTLASEVDPKIEAKAREKVRKWYAEYFKKSYGKEAANEKFTAYINDAVIEIDPHTMYSGPKDNSFADMLAKRYYGIGMELGINADDYFIKRLLPGGTAMQSGLAKENDNIIAIATKDGEMKPVSGMANNDVVAMIRGEKGTTVKMELQQPGEKSRIVEIKRDEMVDTENKAKGAVIEKNGKRYGYIYLPGFYIDPKGENLNGSYNDVVKEMNKMREQQVDGIIMDLRGNGGGSLEEVVKMGNCFMPSSPISWLRSKEVVNNYSSSAKEAMYNGPLTVMVDEASASASEIFAAAIQDLGRGLIVGTSSSYGKGTAQMNMNLGKLGDTNGNTADVSYGSMRLTMEKFYRVNGTTTQMIGVKPEIVFQDRMYWQPIGEKIFSSALNVDTLRFPPINRLKFSFDSASVVNRAKERIANNPAYKNVSANIQAVLDYSKEPVNLELASFVRQYKQANAAQKAIQTGKELPANAQLSVKAATLNSYNPAIHKAEETETPGYKAFLDRIRKDIYIAETVSVLEDMAKGSK
ncbi:carboxyl-terminal processing protease [Chitinophaga skermanii]|uniref:Carboxyl-terminal processing protease n=1 Tax=Chitinophaga skermanii TaxID=331697 RepID=A0A327QVA9_9BACT|nr:carboxy terminal-processing peptidase [Chitinophaga skermanii]RAJ08251.1 carboxyl-terminal processing protease [Chitinophaga skermanii]